MGRVEGRPSAESITSALRAIAAPIFAAAWSSQSELLVHVAAAPRRALVRRQILDAVRGAGVDKARVRFHNAAQLHAPRSLERLVARFGGEDIVYDPTEAVARAKILVGASLNVRVSLDDKLFGLYYAPRLRTFYVALKAASLLVGQKVRVTELANIELIVVAAMKAAFASRLDDCPAIRVGFGLPHAHLVAVDGRSVVRWTSHVASAGKRLWKPITLAALFGFGMTTAATARDPAVSETNLKLSGSGGQTNNDTSWSAGAALTAPLGEFTGVQLEAGGFGVDNDTGYGAGAHLFTRDPDKYLLGLFANYAKEDHFNLQAEQIGAEGELYMRQISLMAKAGYQFSDKLGDHAFGAIDLRWYATDNFALTAGGSYQKDIKQGRLEAEFMPGLSALPGLAFDVKGVIGDDDYRSVMGGLTYYFGSNASLKDRQRKQDPDTSLVNLFQSVEQERARLALIYGN